MNYFNKKLKEREILIKIVKVYCLMLFFPIFISSVLIFGSAFFSYYLFQKGTWGIVVSVFVFFAGIFYLTRTLFVWHYNCLMLTDQRIVAIKQKGFFDRSVSELDLGKISDTSYRIKGFTGTLFHFGVIQIQAVDAANQSLKIEFEKIKNPDKIQELLLTVKKQFEEKISKLPKEETRLLTAEEIIFRTSTQEIFKLIKKFKDDIGEEKFEEILNKIPKS